VLWLSVLAIVAAGAIIYFASKLTGSEALEEFGNIENIKENIDFDNVRSVVFKALVVFAVGIILTSFCGMLTFCIKARPFACLYGCCLLPIWIGVIVLGAIAVVSNQVGKDKLMEECNKVIEKLDAERDASINLPSIPSGVGDPCDQAYNSDVKVTLDVYEAMMIDKEMCSSNCPCAFTPDAADWTGIPKASFGRCRDWVFAPAANSVGTFYQSYEQCLQAAAAVPRTALSTPFQIFAGELEGQEEWSTVKDFLGFFERSYSCAGVCNPAHFYLTKSVNDGKPTGSCVGNLKDAINESFGGLGAATLVSGFLLLAIFICQYCLWYKY
jgi:hypothetical protein